MPKNTEIDHMWIIEVLSDIHQYAAKMKLDRLQETIAESHRIAHEEIIAHDTDQNYHAVMEIVLPFFERKIDIIK